MLNWSIDTRLLMRDAPSFDAYVAGGAANALARAVFEPLFCNLLWLARRDELRASVQVRRRYGSVRSPDNARTADTDEGKVKRFLAQVAGVPGRVSGVPMEYHTSALGNSVGAGKPPFDLLAVMPELLKASNDVLGRTADAPPESWEDVRLASS